MPEYNGQQIAVVPIVVGGSYPFSSTLVGIDGNGIYPARYTGQTAKVLAKVAQGPGQENETDEAMYTVEFPDGAQTGVWECELDGWVALTGQAVTPDAVQVRPGDEPADYAINKGVTQ